MNPALLNMDESPLTETPPTPPRPPPTKLLADDDDADEP
jgi:hypothetical protein